MKRVERVDVTMSDLFHRCCLDPKFFEALIENPRETLEESDYDLPERCVEALLEHLHDVNSKKFLKDLIKLIKKPAKKRSLTRPCIWNTCS